MNEIIPICEFHGFGDFMVYFYYENKIWQLSNEYDDLWNRSTGDFLYSLPLKLKDKYFNTFKSEYGTLIPYFKDILSQNTKKSIPIYTSTQIHSLNEHIHSFVKTKIRLNKCATIIYP